MTTSAKCRRIGSKSYRALIIKIWPTNSFAISSKQKFDETPKRINENMLRALFNPNADKSRMYFRLILNSILSCYKQQSEHGVYISQQISFSRAFHCICLQNLTQNLMQQRCMFLLGWSLYFGMFFLFALWFFLASSFKGLWLHLGRNIKMVSRSLYCGFNIFLPREDGKIFNLQQLTMSKCFDGTRTTFSLRCTVLHS